MSITYSINKDDLILFVVCMIFPTIPVIMRKGFWSKETLINFLLLMTFAVPAIIHGWYLVYKTSVLREDEVYDRFQDSLETGNQTVSSEDTQQEEEAHDSTVTADDSVPVAPPAYENNTKHFPLDNKVQK